MKFSHPTEQEFHHFIKKIVTLVNCFFYLEVDVDKSTILLSTVPSVSTLFSQKATLQVISTH